MPQPSPDMSYVNQTSNEPETFGPTPACRNNHTTAVHGDKIYFHGGHDGNSWLDDLYVLNTSFGSAALNWHPRVCSYSGF